MAPAMGAGTIRLARRAQSGRSRLHDLRRLGNDHRPAGEQVQVDITIKNTSDHVDSYSIFSEDNLWSFLPTIPATPALAPGETGNDSRYLQHSKQSAQPARLGTVERPFEPGWRNSRIHHRDDRGAGSFESLTDQRIDSSGGRVLSANPSPRRVSYHRTSTPVLRPRSSVLSANIGLEGELKIRGCRAASTVLSISSM